MKWCTNSVKSQHEVMYKQCEVPIWSDVQTVWSPNMKWCTNSGKSQYEVMYKQCEVPTWSDVQTVWSPNMKWCTNSVKSQHNTMYKHCKTPVQCNVQLQWYHNIMWGTDSVKSPQSSNNHPTSDKPAGGSRSSCWDPKQAELRFGRGTTSWSWSLVLRRLVSWQCAVSSSYQRLPHGQTSEHGWTSEPCYVYLQQNHTWNEFTRFFTMTDH